MKVDSGVDYKRGPVESVFVHTARFGKLHEKVRVHKPSIAAAWAACSGAESDFPDMQRTTDVALEWPTV